MEYWIVYDRESGEELWRGSGSTGSAAIQPLPDGAALAVVPQQVIAGRDLDLPLLRAVKCAEVDVAAETLRLRFLTPGAGQAMTYTRKEAEARAWTADAAAPVPFLTAEAQARQMTLADLAAEVIAQADAWVTVGAAIEAIRMSAKADVAAAATLGAIVGAANVAWPA